MTLDVSFSDVIKYLDDPEGHVLFAATIRGQEDAMTQLFRYLDEKQFHIRENTFLLIGKLKYCTDWCMRLTLHRQTEEFGREVILPWLLNWCLQYGRTDLPDPWVAYRGNLLYVYIPVHSIEIP